MTGPAKLGLGVGIFSILLFGAIIFYDRQKNATGESPLGTAVDIEGRDHIAMGAAHQPYNSNPPTSGVHYSQSAEWGVYDEPLPDELLVHNLEHGGVNIFYRQDLVDQATIDALKSIQKDFPRKTVLAPRPQNDQAIALASWGYYLKLDKFEETAIREFIRRNKNRAPEFFPD